MKANVTKKTSCCLAAEFVGGFSIESTKFCNSLRQEYGHVVCFKISVLILILCINGVGFCSLRIFFSHDPQVMSFILLRKWRSQESEYLYRSGTSFPQKCKTNHLFCRWQQQGLSYLKYWTIQGIIYQAVFGQTEHLGKNVHMKNFDADEFVRKDLVRKFSTNLNSFGHWDYVFSIHKAFYILCGTKAWAWLQERRRNQIQTNKKYFKNYFI